MRIPTWRHLPKPAHLLCDTEMAIWGLSLWGLEFMDQERPGLQWPLSLPCRLQNLVHPLPTHPRPAHVSTTSMVLSQQVMDVQRPFQVQQGLRAWLFPSHKNDKHYSVNCAPSSTMITTDIHKNGPVEADVPVFAHFLYSP